MPSQKIVEAALKTVRSISGWPSLRVLDLSCGDGQLLDSLRNEGCYAEGTHFRQDDYIYKNPSAALRKAKIHEGVDLAERLPFAEAEYDVVLATEVMEHLPSHVSICSEVGRILKPGGRFIFSTPNIHRLSSRLQFLLAGQHELRSARLCWNVGAADLYATHHNPVYFPSLHTILYQNGMQVEKLVFIECNPMALLLIVFYPIVCAVTAIEARHVLKRSKTGGRDLLKWLIDCRLLFSDQLFIVAKKSDQSSADKRNASVASDA